MGSRGEVFPVLFQLGDLSIPTYGVLNLVAFLAGMAMASYLVQSAGVRFGKYFELAFMIVIAGEIGARLMFVIVEWPSLRTGSIPLKQVLFGGRVVLGGILTAVVFGAWLVRRHNLPAAACVDAGLVGAALGMGIGRLGCLAAGCCYGRPTDLAWGIAFTHPLAERLQGTPLNVPLHPTQILQAATGLLLFAILFYTHRRQAFRGQVTGLYLVLAGGSRLLTELLRGDPRGGGLGLSTSQWIGLGMILVGSLVLRMAARRAAVP